MAGRHGTCSRSGVQVAVALAHQSHLMAEMTPLVPHQAAQLAGLRSCL